MIQETIRTETLSKANPLFNERALKLGTLCTNLSGGCTILTMGGVLKADWVRSTALVRMVEEIEFKAIVPVRR